jgi:predicted DNA-binding transcriptional regulator AlpA
MLVPAVLDSVRVVVREELQAEHDHLKTLLAEWNRTDPALRPPPVTTSARRPPRSPSSDPDRYVGKPELSERFGCDAATILRKVRSGEFPPPVYLFGRCKWKLRDVVAWEAQGVSPEPRSNARNLRNRGARS